MKVRQQEARNFRDLSGFEVNEIGGAHDPHHVETQDQPEGFSKDEEHADPGRKDDMFETALRRSSLPPPPFVADGVIVGGRKISETEANAAPRSGLIERFVRSIKSRLG